MELTVLAVPECPAAAVLRDRLAEALAGRPQVTVTWREVTDAAQAERLGMHGSPTLLVNGVDPFVRPGEPVSLSCRILQPRERGAAGNAPSVALLREILAQAGHGAPGRGGAGRLAPVDGGQRAVRHA